jgi:hypothetical protein
MRTSSSYVVEEGPAGRTVVVTGEWSNDAAQALSDASTDGLVLNYARGFSAQALDFLDSRWALKRLDVLDRGIVDLRPLARLGATLEVLSVQAAPAAELDLSGLPRLNSLAAEWGVLRSTLGELSAVKSVMTWRFDEPDLRAFRDHGALERLAIKEAPCLESLSGVGDLPELRALAVALARRLRDISEAGGLAGSLRELELQAAPGVDEIDDVDALVELRVLGLNDCGDVASLAPIVALQRLEKFHAWGSTRIVDDDLSPLAQLPTLKAIRMRDRRSYNPRVAELNARLD